MRAEHGKGAVRSRGLVLVSPAASRRDPGSGPDIVTASRELWPLLEPSQREIDSAVTHVQRALREPYRSRPRRRMLPLVACVLLLGGAAAYAAQGGLREAVFGQRSEPSAGALESMTARARAVLAELPVADRPVLPDGSTAVAEPAEEALRSSQEPKPEAVELGPGSTVLGQGPVSANAESRAGQAAETSLEEASRALLWATIGQALADGNTALAEKTLRELAASGHAPTVAKAALGLSQVALARGDCVRARDGALTLLAHPGASSAVRRGAERILQSCE